MRRRRGSDSWRNGCGEEQSSQRTNEQVNIAQLRTRRRCQLDKVNLKEKLTWFSDTWNPRIVGELNGQLVKLVKLKGEFIWHKHDREDELFLVLHGQLTIKLRDRDVALEEGEFFIVPRGVEHLPVARGEAHVLLFEPASTLNTGEVRNERTREELETI